MATLLRRDLIGGAAAVLLGGAYLGFAYNIRLSALDDAFGPRGMPLAYGWVMVGLGALLCVTALIDKTKKTFAEEWEGQGRKIAWAAGLLGLGILYLMVVNVLGYLIAMALLTAATMVYQGERLSMKVVLTSVGGSAALWALFVLVLGVSMPAGILAGLGL